MKNWRLLSSKGVRFAFGNNIILNAGGVAIVAKVRTTKKKKRKFNENHENISRSFVIVYATF